MLLVQLAAAVTGTTVVVTGAVHSFCGAAGAPILLD
jgi:hypothetical protein